MSDANNPENGLRFHTLSKMDDGRFVVFYASNETTPERSFFDDGGFG